MYDRNSVATPSGFARTSAIRRSFNDLKVRSKLIVLHNIFFLVLTCAVYFSLIPLFDRTVTATQAHEVGLASQLLAAQGASQLFSKLPLYNYREGGASALGITPEIASWLAAHPGEAYYRAGAAARLFARNPQNGQYRELTIPTRTYDSLLNQARLTLFCVLGIIYIAAVLVLERVIMPYYVYTPLRLMLSADEATRHGEREHELIDERLLLEDEIGEIMRSRNLTVKELRRHEDELASALAQLEVANRDLQQKNHELENARETLAAQDRLVSLGLLSASVAHELNTPLAVLHGSIEKLQETVPGAPAQDRLARMLRVTQRLRKISESLLDFARTRKQEMEPVALRQLLEEAWSLVSIDEKSAEVRFLNQVPESEMIIGNADRLMQVFVNLLRNALHAIKTGGVIEVHSEGFEDNGETWVRLAVEDNGPGIPADVLPNIFDAFVSTRLDARGTGLGLTVAEGIIQQHGGVITASNRSGGGARLEVILRAAPVEVRA